LDVKKMTEVPDKYISWGKIALATAVLLPLGVALVHPTPAAAQSTIIINGGGNHPYRNYRRRNQPQSAPFVYGSPIPAPIPVNPATGLTPRSSDLYSDPAPIREQNITIINVDRPYERYRNNRYPEVEYPRIRTIEVIPAPPIPNGLDPYR
jgi:hypothetical protein